MDILSEQISELQINRSNLVVRTDKIDRKECKIEFDAFFDRNTLQLSNFKCYFKSLAFNEAPSSPLQKLTQHISNSSYKKFQSAFVTLTCSLERFDPWASIKAIKLPFEVENCSISHISG